MLGEFPNLKEILQNASQDEFSVSPLIWKEFCQLESLELQGQAIEWLSRIGFSFCGENKKDSKEGELTELQINLLVASCEPQVEELLKNVLLSNYPQKEFYQILVDELLHGNHFPTPVEKAYALTSIYMDNHLPYYYIGEITPLPLPEYQEIYKSLSKEVDCLSHIMHRPFEYCIDCAVYLEQYLSQFENEKERKVLLASILKIMQRKTTLEILDQED